MSDIQIGVQDFDILLSSESSQGFSSSEEAWIWRLCDGYARHTPGAYHGRQTDSPSTRAF